MTRRDYRLACSVINENLSPGPERELVVDMFVEFFKKDSERFEEKNFRDILLVEYLRSI